jgi:hypothetical protein
MLNDFKRKKHAYTFDENKVQLIKNIKSNNSDIVIGNHTHKILHMG